MLAIYNNCHCLLQIKLCLCLLRSRMCISKIHGEINALHINSYYTMIQTCIIYIFVSPISVSKLTLLA